MPVDDNVATPEGLASIHAMFVQTAHAAVTRFGRMTLLGVSRSTLYFADRPQRVVGHIHSWQFVDMWAVGANSFAESPPNAVLSFIEPGSCPDAVPADVVVVLRSPQVNDDELTYHVEMLDGVLPDRAQGCALFIDPFGRPAAPESVAGVRRPVRHGRLARGR